MAFGTLVSRSKFYKNPKVLELVNILKETGVLDKFYDEHFTPGVIKRTEYIHQFFEKQFRENPRTSVLSIGCGFSTYYYDLPHDHNVKWVNSDLSDVTLLRYTHWGENYDPSLNFHLVTLDLNDDNAITYLQSMANKVDVLLAEGVLMYLPKERAKEILSLGWKTIVFDVLGSKRTVPLGKNHLWTYEEGELDLNVVNSYKFDGQEKDSTIFTVKGR